MAKRPEKRSLTRRQRAHYDAFTMTTTRKREGEIFEKLKPCFRRAVARLRAASGRSPEKLAKQAGIDPKTLRRMEEGRGTPLREDYIDGICRVLDISMANVLRTAADCYEEEQKRVGPSLQDNSAEDLIEKKKRAYDARARADRDLLEIELELQRRQFLGQADRDG